MVRLNFIVEGQTEETFVNNVLTPYLSSSQVYSNARRVETGRSGNKRFRGGMTNYYKARRDITRWMSQDHNADARFTTMFDLYALPNDFPCYDEAICAADPYQRASILENAMKKDIGDTRFIPYIQLYEFEALLLADPRKLEVEFQENVSEIKQLTALVSGFKSPEHINLDRSTAPSKRIIDAIPAYRRRKSSSGPIVARSIGLQTLRDKCRHFGQWLAKLETLNETDALA